MDRNREKPPTVFINPFAAWTELALRMWGFGRSGERVSVPARPVAVAVIPSSDAPETAKRKPAKRAAKAQPGQIWIKRTILEMGGKDSIIVSAGADLDQAVARALAAKAERRALSVGAGASSGTRDSFRKRLRNNELNDKEVEILTDYFPSSGTGQLNAIFPLP